MISFALYKLPFSKNYIEIIGDQIQYSSLSDVEAEKGFVITSFSGKCVTFIKECSSSSFSVDSIPFVDACHSNELASVLASSDAEKRDYFDSYSRFYSAIDSGLFEKLVLSRKHSFSLSSDVNEEYVRALFGRACKKYPSAFVYVASIKGGGYWFGCSPELLVESSKSGCHSVALAGTMTVNLSCWSGKNRAEQAYVADFVRDIVKQSSISFSESSPYSVEAGAIKHLKTDFNFSLKEGISILDVALLLHPTPAVCGVPKDKALPFIANNEGYDRSFYSGIVGVVGEYTNLFVNLRCCSFCGKDVSLYAGGGIVKASDAESEWLETESKLKTILNIL